MGYKDVREWIEKVGTMGELKVIEGTDWNLEIGALSVLASKHKENTPALLFDRIKDYPAGHPEARMTGLSFITRAIAKA